MVVTLKKIYLAQLEKEKGNSKAEGELLSKLSKLFHYDITPLEETKNTDWKEYPSDVSDDDQEGFEEWRTALHEEPGVKPVTSPAQEAASGFGDIHVIPPPQQPPRPLPTATAAAQAAVRTDESCPLESLLT